MLSWAILMRERLKCNENDIRKAIKQAEATRRLIDSGVDPYARFQELNNIARNIALSAREKRRQPDPRRK